MGDTPKKLQKLGQVSAPLNTGSKKINESSSMSSFMTSIFSVFLGEKESKDVDKIGTSLNLSGCKTSANLKDSSQSSIFSVTSNPVKKTIDKLSESSSKMDKIYAKLFATDDELFLKAPPDLTVSGAFSSTQIAGNSSNNDESTDKKDKDTIGSTEPNTSSSAKDSSLLTSASVNVAQNESMQANSNATGGLSINKKTETSSEEKYDPKKDPANIKKLERLNELAQKNPLTPQEQEEFNKLNEELLKAGVIDKKMKTKAEKDKEKEDKKIQENNKTNESGNSGSNGDGVGGSGGGGGGGGGGAHGNYDGLNCKEGAPEAKDNLMLAERAEKLGASDNDVKELEALEEQRANAYDESEANKAAAAEAAAKAQKAGKEAEDTEKKEIPPELKKLQEANQAIEGHDKGIESNKGIISSADEEIAKLEKEKGSSKSGETDEDKQAEEKRKAEIDAQIEEWRKKKKEAEEALRTAEEELAKKRKERDNAAEALRKYQEENKDKVQSKEELTAISEELSKTSADQVKIAVEAQQASMKKFEEIEDDLLDVRDLTQEDGFREDMTETEIAEAIKNNPELAASLADGKPIQVGDKLYLSGEEITPLNITPQQFKELFSDIDFKQGNVGDCYFVAALDSMMQTPEGRKAVYSVLKDDGNGNVYVNFKDGTGGSGYQYDGMKYADKGFQLIEDAFFQAGGSKWGGMMYSAYKKFGMDVSTGVDVSDESLDRLAEEHAILTAGTSALIQGANYGRFGKSSSLGGHAYSIEVLGNNTVLVTNPWDTHATFKMTYSEFRRFFNNNMGGGLTRAS